MTRKKKTGPKPIYTKTQAKKRANASRTKWHQEHTTRLSFSLNNEKDKDIIDHLNTKPSKTEYVKGLIRKDIDK